MARVAGKGKNAEVRRREASVARAFVESILDNVLLGGFLVTGIIILTQNFVPKDYVNALALAYIAVPLLAWWYRYRLAEEDKKDI